MNELRRGLGIERSEPREDRLDLVRRKLCLAFSSGFARRGFVSFALGRLIVSCAHGRDITEAEAQDVKTQGAIADVHRRRRDRLRGHAQAPSLTQARRVSPGDDALLRLGRVSSIPFIIFGAWPVAGFYGLDILALFIAFKINYRRARAEERVRLTYVELLLRKITHRGETAEWRFNPLWSRLALEEDADFGALRLQVVSGRHTVPIGDFLAPPQRRDLADALGAALIKAKRGPDLT